jgi:hypothetical protein
LPASAASVSTLVVSWKLAAEMKLSDCTAALVMPRSWVLAAAGLGRIHSALRPPDDSTRRFSWSKWSRGTMSPWRKSVSPGSLILTQFISSWFLARNSNLSMTEPGKRPVSPTDSTRTLRSICATMISRCLSSISTRWER